MTAKIIILVLLIITNAHAAHNVVLIDTATTSNSAEQIKAYIMALEQAFDKYLLQQDTLTVYTFTDKEVTQHFFHESVSRRDYILHRLKNEFKDSFAVGCADWTKVLSTLYHKHVNAQNVYLITDENPCSKKDPSYYARKLQLEGINTVAIGIGPNFRKSKKWLNSITSKTHEPVYLEDISFLQRKRYIESDKLKRHPTSSDPAQPLTGGEIAAVVIVSVVLFVLLVASLVYACRYNNEERRVKIKRRPPRK